MGRTYRRRRRRRRCRPLTATINTGDDHQKIRSLIGWLRNKDRRLAVGRQRSKFMSSAKLRPHRFASTGRGLQCCRRQHIGAGQLLLAIPIQSMITRNTVLDDSPDLPIDGRRRRTELSDVELLTAWIYWERQKAEASHWSDYFQSLPDRFDELPYMWPNVQDICRSLPVSLATELMAARNTYRRSMAKVFDELGLCLLDNNDDNDEQRLFNWSFGAVNTRCVYLDTDDCSRSCALAPFLDLLNHSATAKVTVTVNRDNNQSYEIYTDCHYRPYDEVFISYGNHDNRFLFINYGFCCFGDTGNNSLANDSIPVSYRQVRDVLLDNNSNNNISDRQQVMSRLKTLLRLDFCNERQVYWLQSQSFDWRLDIILRLLSLNSWSNDTTVKQWIYNADGGAGGGGGSVELDIDEDIVYRRLKRSIVDSLISEYDINVTNEWSLLGDNRGNDCLKQLLSNEFAILSAFLTDL
ncbi:SET domain-containing protein 4-like [Oppia nitens]|uniref:SET domain-containing protein 4-like n=1 Tax=Oppia nitens TaxID=1686743 RepID=UPI0023DC18CE|nr:SET domain-containing protein 4-like [Oppia nitens]